MATSYDMCVDYDTLMQIEERLKKIQYDLLESAKRMNEALHRSKDFLAGNQFEKAKNTTADCLILTERTGNNIRYAMCYIEEILHVLEDYSKCGYAGEER